MKKILGICISTFLFMFSILSPSIANAAEIDGKATRKKPSGNFCGKDKLKPRGMAGKDLYFKPKVEFPDPGDMPLKRNLSPKWFDKFTVIHEGNACSFGWVVAEYINNSRSEITHTFSEEASKSTTFSASVDADFKEVFQASLGYSATNTVARKVKFHVLLKKGERCIVKVRPSLHIITGEWSYLTGSQEVSVYYPTHLTWEASENPI